MGNYGHQPLVRQGAQLSICLVVGIFLFSCGQDVAARSVARSKPTRAPLPCVFRTTIFMHNKKWDLDQCTTCTCEDGVVNCSLKAERPVNCEEQNVDGTRREPQPENEDFEETSPNELSCVYQGTILLHGDTFHPDACITCICRSGSVSCRNQICPAITCTKTVTKEGECCPYCPNNLVVESLTPKVKDKNALRLHANQNNLLQVKVKVKFSDTGNATEVIGKKLWGLGVWLSPSRKNGLPRYGYVNQILSDRQSSKNYMRDRKFSFRGITYQFNDTSATCDDMKYICAELRRGESVKPEHFQLEGFNDNSSLTGCSPAPKCET